MQFASTGVEHKDIILSQVVRETGSLDKTLFDKISVSQNERDISQVVATGVDEVGLHMLAGKFAVSRVIRGLLEAFAALAHI